MLEIVEIPIEKIKVGEHDQRIDFDEEEIAGLAFSIGRLGVLSPLLVEETGDTFQLVSGHRRLLASIRVGLSNLPCIVKDSAKVDTNEVTFAENYFRKDLSPVELAGAIKDCLDKKIMSIEELAAGFHRSTHWVNSMIAIAGWPDDILEAIHVKAISVSAASNLAMVTDEKYRMFLLRNAVDSGATARSTAAWLQGWRAVQPAEEAIQAEPVSMGTDQTPMVPQAPCLCCAQLFEVNMMSHVPVCGACIQMLRIAGASGDVRSMPTMQEPERENTRQR